jgi:stage V sporulation protein G
MKIERMNKGSWGKIRAFIDVRTDDGFVIKGFKLIEGVNGLFVGFPSQKSTDGEYHDTVWADKEIKDQLSQLAIKGYGGDVMTNTGYDNTATSKKSSSDSFSSQNTAEPYSDEDIPF